MSRISPKIAAEVVLALWENVQNGFPPGWITSEKALVSETWLFKGGESGKAWHEHASRMGRMLCPSWGESTTNLWSRVSSFGGLVLVVWRGDGEAKEKTKLAFVISSGALFCTEEFSGFQFLMRAPSVVLRGKTANVCLHRNVATGLYNCFWS